MSWDRRSPARQAADQQAAVRRQLQDAVAPFSPFWKERLGAVRDVEGLAALPPVGERELCPDADPAGAAALVLQVGEAGWALHAEGPRLRQGLSRRLLRPAGYAAIVEADTRPTSYVQAGLALRFPLASTRSDLDVVARAGARLWQVLGLTRDDVLVAALPLGPTAVLQGLQLAALGAGAPAMFPGDHPDDVADALELLPATVLAVPCERAADVLDDLDEAGAPLAGVRTLLLVGAPSPAERSAADAALARVGAAAVVLAVHVPDGHRLVWGECRQGGPGLHTYPDLELVQLVDPETGRTAATGELVLTQLGLRGSALVRWRTADVAGSVELQACPGCARTVPRVVGVQRAALVPTLSLRGGPLAVDLRALAAALDARADVGEWRLELGAGRGQGDLDVLLVHVLAADPGEPPAATAVAVARDVARVVGRLPTQVVVAADAGRLPSGTGPSRRTVVRAPAGPARQG